LEPLGGLSGFAMVARQHFDDWQTGKMKRLPESMPLAHQRENLQKSNWRRERDSNPRKACGVHYRSIPLVLH
jgi:hypothetical protein